MGSCVEGAIPLAVVGLHRRTHAFVMCGSSARGHGGTSATAMRCWHSAAPSITVPSIGYLNAIDSDFERRKNHRMLLGDLWRTVLGDSNSLLSTTVPNMTVNASFTESTSFGRPFRYVESVPKRMRLHRHQNIIMWRPWRALRMSLRVKSSKSLWKKLSVHG